MTKRRTKGEGSVYRRGDGRIVGEYEDANGKRRYVSAKTKADVRAKLRKLLADRDAGLAYDSENLTVGGYLDRWLEAVKGSVRERTWRRHEQVVRVHLKPTIGRVRLDRLNALQVQAVYRQKLDDGLSARTVEIIHATLHKALKQAVGWSLVPRNVAEAVTTPRSVRKEITPLTGDQVRFLLEATRGDKLEALYSPRTMAYPEGFMASTVPRGFHDMNKVIIEMRTASKLATIGTSVSPFRYHSGGSVVKRAYPSKTRFHRGPCTVF